MRKKINNNLDKLIFKLKDKLKYGTKITVRNLNTIELLNVNIKIKTEIVIKYKYDKLEFKIEFAKTLKQLTQIISKLKVDKYSRQCITINWKSIGLPPCIVMLQFIYRNNKLHLISFLRSSDVNRLKNDIISLAHILKIVSNKTLLKTGYIYLHITSLHSYV